ncbi:uncharacterized protein LOC124196316 [Daphnia pulex]|uniref:uncharacterized protein LOC124196316 n=1 Tax=Daphnia pulex TaxID=6669 RepID=UPI001EE01EDC|nr:uncharacterized protein LOC124196316 [Daphnia pulex]
MASEELSSIVHRLFVVGYSLTTCLAIMVSVSSGVVTDYWKETIDGCILYSDIYQDIPTHNSKGQPIQQSKIPVHNSSWVMIGSDISVCNYTTFTPIFFIFIAMMCISYHLRNLFCKHCWRAEESDVKSDFWEMMVRLLVVLSSLMTLLALVVACVLTHGHDYTCSGLRHYVTSQGLSPWLGISSLQIHELFERLDCGFFYSALDHGLKLVTEHDDENEGITKAIAVAAVASNSASIIDSNSALEVAMATGWFQFFVWLALAVANIWLAIRLKIQMFPESLNLPAIPNIFNKE